MNEETLTALVDTHESGIYRYLVYLGAGHAAAEDVLQDTFLAAYQNRSPENDPAKVGAWLRGIARNIFRKHCRKRKMSPILFDDAALAAAESYWRETAETGFDQIMLALDSCLKKLPDKQRELIIMRYDKSISRRSMAELTGMTPDGIKSALRRIREGLADCIRREREAEK